MEGAEAAYQCYNCDAAFPNKKDLLSHTKIDHEKYGILCHPCGNGFKKQNDLRFHRRECIFVDEARSKPVQERFKCLQCKGGIFNDAKELEFHYGQKHCDYKIGCCFCGNHFKTRGNLNIHLRECFHREVIDKRH